MVKEKVKVKVKVKGDEDGEEDPVEETPDKLVIDPNQPWDQGSTQVGGLKDHWISRQRSRS